MENVLSLEWLICHESMRYMGAHDEPCDLAIWVSKSLWQTRSL